jgi:undecaprenyl pyrophosphate synthase
MSSTNTIPEVSEVPRHVAIIMDGNGRWAKKRFLPRVGGHRRGVETVREVVKACIEHRGGVPDALRRSRARTGAGPPRRSRS